MPTEIARGRLRASIDPEVPRLWLRGRAGEALLAALAPDLPDPLGAAWRDGRRVVATGQVKGRAGAMERVEIQAWQSGGLGVRWCIELDAAGLCACLAVENRGPEPLALPPLHPLVMRGVGAPSEVLSLWRDEDGAARENLVLLGATGGAERLLGFLSARRGWTRWLLRGGEAWALNEISESVLAPGAAIETDRAWIGVGAGRAPLLEEWARRAGLEMEARAPQRPRVTWPSAPDAAPCGAIAPAALREAGPPRDARAADAVAYRAHLAGLRAAGEAADLLVVAGPPLASVGLADAVRMADDLVLHAHANQRLWLAASGPLRIGAGVPPHVARSRLSLAALAGGLVELTVPPGTLDAPRRAWLRRALPPLGREAVGVREDLLLVRLRGERIAVVLLNRDRAPRRLGLAFAEIGRAGPLHGFDFWRNEDLGLLETEVPPRRVPPGGCRVLALTPVAERPQVVGSGIHIGMGTLEVASLRPGRGGQLALALRHPGRHAGDVWIAAAGEPRARRVPVRFTDAAQLQIRTPR